MRVGEIKCDGLVCMVLLPGFSAVNVTHNSGFPPALKNLRPSCACEVFQELAGILVLVQIGPIAQQGSPRAQGMYM